MFQLRLTSSSFAKEFLIYGSAPFVIRTRAARTSCQWSDPSIRHPLDIMSPNSMLKRGMREAIDLTFQK